MNRKTTKILSILRMVEESSSSSLLLANTRQHAEVVEVVEVPHKGMLCRFEDNNNTAGEETTTTSYAIAIHDQMNNTAHELCFHAAEFEFISRLFAILDTESANIIHKNVIARFVTTRCPVISKRDEDVRSISRETQQQQSSSSSSTTTFDEIWNSVIQCSRRETVSSESDARVEFLGLEGWMVLCRFVALAQYLEAKRRFSARHLQQTMRHRNSPRGSEVVVVDVPPPEPPVPITPAILIAYERDHQTCLPLPELDLDHSLLAAHDLHAINHNKRQVVLHSPKGASSSSSSCVKLALFGSEHHQKGISSSALASLSSPPSSSTLEFAVTYTRGGVDDIVVRRSMDDIKWLNETFVSHRKLGCTLSGRILPPFPSKTHHTTFDESSYSSLKSTAGGAIHAATAGVGRIRDVAKSLIGSYVATTESTTETSSLVTTTTTSANTSTNIQAKKLSNKKNKRKNLSLPEDYYNPNSPLGKARRVERYLNYLLEHPALSSSFPLFAMLTTSQLGLEAARQILEECDRKSKELKAKTPQLGDGKLGISLSPNSPNFAWVRSAAQAAVALKVHGMLETTGMPSASARLQHASLPVLPSARASDWEEDAGDGHQEPQCMRNDDDSRQDSGNFEEGVVHDDGFDLLPLPVPAPERRILAAGSDNFVPVSADASCEERFHYGTGAQHDRFSLHDEVDVSSAFLGDIAVAENIDKLREVIGSVESTLSRCLASCGGIGKVRRERQNLDLNIVRGLDSWAGMRGKFVAQRSLMKGVAGIEQSKEVYEESDLALIDDLSWQTSLAASAVTAAEDAREAVRVSRTASNARAAASSAAYSAQLVCEKDEFATLDEARAAQTRSSIAQSHAIHAAVVEYEAKSMKRKTMLALAHDVMTWNIHRKREMLQSCVAYARSQHEATRRAVDAWSTLRDGFIGAPVNPPILERKTVPLHRESNSAARQSIPTVDPGEVTATIFSATMDGESQLSEIVAVDHNILTTSTTMGLSEIAELPNEGSDLLKKSTDGSDHQVVDRDLPFAEAAPIISQEAIAEVMQGSQATTRNDDKGKETCFHELDPDSSFSNDEKMSASMQSLVDGLMNWGGGFDVEEEHFALPMGLAASIVLEENNALGRF